MPGKPSHFTNNTIIILNGDSGSGKTTMASFLQKGRKDISIVRTDNFFCFSSIKKYHSHESYSDLLKIYKGYDKPYHYINNINAELFKHSKLIKIFEDYLKDNIKMYFKDGAKLLIIEGTTMKNKKILNYIEDYCKEESIKLWIMNSF